MMPAFAACLLALLLTACQPHTFDTVGDAVGFCMVLEEVPVRVEGKVTC